MAGVQRAGHISAGLTDPLRPILSYPSPILPRMTEIKRRQIQPQAVWDQVRKAWEDGETARVLAKRYDVGVHALWKRREAEGWKRPDPRMGPVEPAEGWDRFAQAKLDRFCAERDHVRELALDLIDAMTEGQPGGAPLWHLGFIYDWRAKNLSPEAAAGDRERSRASGAPWYEAFWDQAGKLRPLWALDRAVLDLNRDTWREQMGLPDGVAKHWP